MQLAGLARPVSRNIPQVRTNTLYTSSAAQQAARLDCSVVSHNIKIEKKVKLVSLKLCVWKSRVHESYIKSWRHVEVFMEKPQLVSILQFLES